MKNFMKEYLVMIISILFFGIYGMLMGMVFSSDALFANDVFGITAVIVTIILVIAIFGEMIYLIIHAANNKRLKNSILWCLGIYFLNVFIIPYYYIKHVLNDKEVKNKMIIFGALTVVFFVGGLLMSLIADEKSNKDPLRIEEEDVRFVFPVGYREMDIGEYDVYVKDRIKNINYGIFVYDEDDYETTSSIMIARDRWINNSRDEVMMISTYNEELEDRIIYINVYVGTNNGVKNIYYISTVEFKNTDVFINSIGVNLYEDYLDYQEQFKQILLDMEYIGYSH